MREKKPLKYSLMGEQGVAQKKKGLGKKLATLSSSLENSNIPLYALLGNLN